MPVCGNYLFFELPKKIVLNPKDGQRREITWNIWTDVFFAVCVRSSSILNRYRPCGIRRSTLRTARALRSAGPIIFRPSRHSPHISKNCPCDVEFSCFFLQIIVKYLVVCAILPCRKISHIANRSRLPRFPAIRVPQGMRYETQRRWKYKTRRI